MGGCYEPLHRKFLPILHFFGTFILAQRHSLRLQRNVLVLPCTFSDLQSMALDFTGQHRLSAG